MVEQNYMRLRSAGEFFFPVEREATKPKRGGKRAGSGKKISAEALFKRDFVGAPSPKRCVCGEGFYQHFAGNRKLCNECSARAKALKNRHCEHEKPTLLNGRKRKVCFDCAPKNASNKTKSLVSIKRTRQHVCPACKDVFTANTKANKYCSAKCRNKVSNTIGLKTIQARATVDPVFALKHRLRSLIRVSVRRGGYSKTSRTHDILGCDWATFAAHIERQFLPGMSWGRLGEIHFDHIVASSSAATEKEVLALNHFTNLRPMWAKDNMSKGARTTHLI